MQDPNRPTHSALGGQPCGMLSVPVFWWAPIFILIYDLNLAYPN